MKNTTSWFSGLKGKLLILAVVPVLMLCGLSYVSFNSINTLSDLVSRANKVRVPKMKLLGDIDAARHAIFRYLWATHESENNLEERSKATDKLNDYLKMYNDAYKDFLAMDLDEKEKQLFEPVQKNWSISEPIIQEVIKLLAKNTPNENNLARELLFSKLRPAYAPIGVALDQMDKEYRERADKATKDGELVEQNSKQIILVVSVVGALTLLFGSLYLASQLSTNLVKITSELQESGVQVAVASEQLSSASQQLSQGATESASSLEETVSSVEELTSMVKINAEHAKEAAEVSSKSRVSADEGEKEIQKLIKAMNEVANSSKKIEEIINVIDDIAFQTNLLALNAAVEAARAGEQGKGFAVVAEAVRTLAQRSSAAAKDITSLIKDSVTKSDDGAKAADRSGTVLKNIITEIKKVSDLNSEISAASQQQAEGLSQISKAMNQLDQSTQSNAASAEEAAASSEELSAQSETMKLLVNQLGKIVYGGTEVSSDGSSSHQTRNERRTSSVKNQNNYNRFQQNGMQKMGTVMKWASKSPTKSVKPLHVVSNNEDDQNLMAS